MDWMTNYIKENIFGYKLMLEFMGRITLIQGDSGVGKTIVFNYLNRQSYANDKILCVNAKYVDNLAKTDKSGLALIKELKQYQKSLIVIDNADTILNDSVRKHIGFDLNNQYIIFGRNVRGLFITENTLADLVRDDSRKIIYTYYKFKDVNKGYDGNLDRG